MAAFFFIFFFVVYVTCLSTSNVLELNYTQKLDHFGVGGIFENYTFQQRLVVDSTYWSGPKNKGPLMVLLGGEAPIGMTIGQIGIITEAAPRLQALVVYIEHRFYGKSIPLGSIDTAMLSPMIRSYLSMEQALADFADIILSLKANLSAANSPVIVLGCSYAGILAAWFRLQYPNIAIGALSSSAPILFYENIPSSNDYCSIITRDFEHVNKKCANIIRQSWNLIDEIASRVDGLDVLTKTFNLCSSLVSAYELKAVLAHTYAFAAQFNGRYNMWINFICDPIVEASKGKSIIEGIAHALQMLNSDQSCFDLSFTGLGPFNVLDANSQKAWNWQLCSELFLNKSCHGHDSMLPQEVFLNQTQYMEYCHEQYFEWPHPDWARKYSDNITRGSNIMFANGLMDPYSSAGILDDISDTIVAIKTKQGSHCLDFGPVRKDDPKWLAKQRKKETRILMKWANGGLPTTTFPINLATSIIHVLGLSFFLLYLV